MGQYTPLMLFGHIFGLRVLVLLCILLCPLCFLLLYLHNTLYTKNAGSHICISNLKTFRILSSYSCLSDIPKNHLPFGLAVSPQAYVYDLALHGLLLCLRVCARITLAILLLFLFSISHILLSFYTLAQTLCDIDISSLYAINCMCH